MTANLAAMGDEANLAKTYRQERRDFIAACEGAGADVISRVHPAKGPDGKPLFCDSAAFGPRDGTKALLLICADGAPADFLGQGLALPKGARLVAVHALDPFAHAWGKPGKPANWPQKTLADIAIEDLAKVKKLTLLDLSGAGMEPALAAALPQAVLTVRSGHSETAILSAIAAL